MLIISISIFSQQYKNIHHYQPFMRINLLTPSTQIVKSSLRIIGFKKQLYYWLLVLLLSPFGLIAQAPTISNFTPSSGPVGTLVTITGTNLTTPTALTIGGVAAIAISNTGTSLVAMVMPGAVTGAVSIITAGGTANGTGNFTVTASQTPNAQQGNKLVGTGATGAAFQGYAVAVSADGNTAIVGGYNDNSGVGAAWVYTRSGGVWTQQGSKLVGTGATGAAQQGRSVAVSADGNTAIVGGIQDNSGAGATWVYTYIPPPTISSATYDVSSGVLTVTGTNLLATVGVTNDIDISKLTLTGEASSSYTLTTANVEITNSTSFSVTLNTIDKAAVNQLLNKNGTS